VVDVRETVTTVPHLDLDRYLGIWFEICRLPLKWEDQEARDITAAYSAQADGSVRVDNRCLKPDGKPERAIGRAVPVDATNARLRVSFLPGFLRWLPFAQGDYWVLRISDSYDVALVGTPDRANLWLLSRTANLPEEIKAQFLATAKKQGFDLSALITPRQSGSSVPDTAFND